LRAVPLDQPPAARLNEAIAALDGYHRRFFNFTHRPSGVDLSQFRMMACTDVVVAAVAALLHPDSHVLRLPPDAAADMFLALYAARRQLPPAQLIELFLHGALTTPAG
jgi:hypothetical protein